MNKGHNGYNKYMSYFQKVTTVGVVTCATNKEEASKLAEIEMTDGNTVERCYYDETKFKLSDTQEWNPDFEIISVDPSADNKHLDYTIKANEEYSKCVSEFCGKPVGELTDKDYENFFLDCAKEFIEKGEKVYGKVDG